MTAWKWIALLFTGTAAAPPTFIESTPVTKLDPLYAITAGDHRAAALVYDTILTPNNDESWKSRVLDDWSTARDGSLQLVMKPKRRWHDGEPVTGVDLCTSLTALRHPDTVAPIAQLAKSIAVDCAVDPQDPLVVNVRLSERSLNPWRHFEIPLLPAHQIQDAVRWDTLTPPIGSGPYSATFDGRRWAFRAHPRRAGALAFQTLHREYTPHGTAQANALMGGGVDGMIEVPPPELVRLREAGGLQLRFYERERWTTLLLDTAEGPTQSRDVRAAIEHAIDQHALREEVIGLDSGRDAQACQVVTGPYDPRDARYNHSVRLDVEEPSAPQTDRLVLGVFEGTDDRERLTRALSRALAAAGFHVTWELLEGEAWTGSVLAGARAGDLDGILTTLRRDEGLDAFLRTRSERAGALQPFSAGHPEVDHAFEAIQRSSTPIAAARTLHAVLAQTHTIIPLWQKDSWTAWSSDRVQHLAIHPDDYFGNIQDWTSPM